MSALDDITTGYKRLSTRRGDFLLRDFDSWTLRGQVTPVAEVLMPGGRICMLGRCFAARSSA